MAEPSTNTSDDYLNPVLQTRRCEQRRPRRHRLSLRGATLGGKTMDLRSSMQFR
jgi:hypothetical protein